MDNPVGSSLTPAVPRSLATRPQYGSPPNHEHLTSWLSATLRAAWRASSSDAAPVTRTFTTLVCPSASPTSWVARSRQAAATAAANAAGSAGAPERPLASSSTVSLVDVQPSTVTALKLSATPACRMRSSVDGSTSASVVRTASMVARLGASIAAPPDHQPRHAGGDQAHGQREADQAGGADQNGLGRAAQPVGGERAHPLGVELAQLAGGCVGVAAREHDRGRPAPPWPPGAAGSRSRAPPPRGSA